MEYTYKSQSSKKKDEAETLPEKKVEKVVSGTVKRKKKSEMKKFADIFISEDVSSVKSYVFMDILVPAAKKAISDIVTKGVDMFLYGDADRSRRGSSPAGRVSYSGYYNRDSRRDPGYSRSRATYDYDDIVLETRGEADNVLDTLIDTLNEYGTVSVADLYDLVGITGDYTAHKYGWTDLRTAGVDRIRDGYVLKLPRAIALK